MSSSLLALPIDLSGRGVDVPIGLATRALAAASAAVREAAGSHITRATSTVTLEAAGQRRLRLPAQPVVSVQSVAIDGAPVSDWRLVSGGLWRPGGWGSRCGAPSLVEVTFTHGLGDVPADIKELVCDLAIAGVNAAAEGAHVGLAYESLDDYRVGYLQGAEATASVWELPLRTSEMLRRRFGGAVYVTDEAR